MNQKPNSTNSDNMTTNSTGYPNNYSSGGYTGKIETTEVPAPNQKPVDGAIANIGDGE